MLSVISMIGFSCYFILSAIFYLYFITPSLYLPFVYPTCRNSSKERELIHLQLPISHYDLTTACVLRKVKAQESTHHDEQSESEVIGVK